MVGGDTMARDYNKTPNRDYEHSIKDGRNDYQNKFFHDIDLDFILEYMQKIESGEYKLEVKDRKLRLINNATGEVVSEVDISTGSKGEPGEDGFSPVVTTERTTDGIKISITDKSGTTITEVKDGKTGPAGPKGADSTVPGPDGSSAFATSTRVDDGVIVTTTDKNGTTTAKVNDGKPGENGSDGKNFQILNVYDTYEEMIADNPHPEVGQAFQVGRNTEYYTKSETDTKFQEKLIPGENITIENNVISAAGGGGGSGDTKTTTYYVRPQTGSDDNDGLSPETAFATIAKAMLMPGNVDVNVVSEEPYTEHITRYIPLSGRVINVSKNYGSESIAIRWDLISFYGGSIYFNGIDVIAESMYMGVCSFYCNSLSISGGSTWNGAHVTVAGELTLSGWWHNCVGGSVQSQSRTGNLTTSCGTYVYPEL